MAAAARAAYAQGSAGVDNQSMGVDSPQAGRDTKNAAPKASLPLLPAHSAHAATDDQAAAALADADAAAENQAGAVAFAAAAATNADADFDPAVAVDTYLQAVLVLQQHLVDSTLRYPVLAAAGQRQVETGEAASSDGLPPAACLCHPSSQMLRVHCPLQVGVLQRCLVILASPADIGNGKDTEKLADRGSQRCGWCYLKACTTAAAAAAVAAASAAAAAAAVAAASAAAAAVATVADEEALLQPDEVLVSWIWPTELPLLLHVICNAALPQETTGYSCTADLVTEALHNDGRCTCRLMHDRQSNLLLACCPVVETCCRGSLALQGCACRHYIVRWMLHQAAWYG